MKTQELLQIIQEEIELVLLERCQKGYKTHPKRKTKKMYGKTYRNCIKADEVLDSDEEDLLDEDLGAWFGKGQKAAPEARWDRYNTKGERIGKCGDSKPGEGKPKCLSKSKAASLRASGGKKAIANAVKRKRKEDPNKNRRGKAKNVSNRPKKKKRKKS